MEEVSIMTFKTSGYFLVIHFLSFQEKSFSLELLPLPRRTARTLRRILAAFLQNLTFLSSLYILRRKEKGNLFYNVKKKEHFIIAVV